MAFDPDDAAQPGSGIFGVNTSRADAAIVLKPVPFDATASYRRGSAAGPDIIAEESVQVDLFDHQFGAVHAAGIWLDSADPVVIEMNDAASTLTAPLIELGGAGGTHSREVEAIDAASERVTRTTQDWAREALRVGKVPGLLGGEHSVALGNILACAERLQRENKPLGILQIDAHMDLRRAYLGFAQSHASVMFNTLERIPNMRRLVQIGIRDYGARERRLAEAAGNRVVTHYDLDWWRRIDAGERFFDLAKSAIDALPEHVYITFDIDGLDPCLCPGTGTPVPGGLSFQQASVLLEVLAQSGKRIVGFDLVEVAPVEAAPQWDATVGARLLYKLCGCVAVANRLLPPAV